MKGQARCRREAGAYPGHRRRRGIGNKRPAEAERKSFSDSSLLTNSSASPPQRLVFIQCQLNSPEMDAGFQQHIRISNCLERGTAASPRGHSKRVACAATKEISNLLSLIHKSFHDAVGHGAARGWMSHGVFGESEAWQEGERNVHRTRNARGADSIGVLDMDAESTYFSIGPGLPPSI